MVIGAYMIILFYKMTSPTRLFKTPRLLRSLEYVRAYRELILSCEFQFLCSGQIQRVLYCTSMNKSYLPIFGVARQALFIGHNKFDLRSP